VDADDKWDYLEYRLATAKQTVASKQEAYAKAELELLAAWRNVTRYQQEMQEVENADDIRTGREAEITGTTEDSGKS